MIGKVSTEEELLVALNSGSPVERYVAHYYLFNESWSGYESFPGGRIDVYEDFNELFESSDERAALGLLDDLCRYRMRDLDGLGAYIIAGPIRDFVARFPDYWERFDFSALRFLGPTIRLVHDVYTGRISIDQYGPAVYESNDGDLGDSEAR